MYILADGKHRRPSPYQTVPRADDASSGQTIVADDDLSGRLVGDDNSAALARPQHLEIKQTFEAPRHTTNKKTERRESKKQTAGGTSFSAPNGKLSSPGRTRRKRAELGTGQHPN